SACLRAPHIPEIYTLSLHDALPIFKPVPLNPLLEQIGQLLELHWHHASAAPQPELIASTAAPPVTRQQLRGLADIGHRKGLLERSEEHTSELQSRENLVCRLLLEKK